MKKIVLQLIAKNKFKFILEKIVDQQSLMLFEKGVDEFLSSLKNRLNHNEDISVSYQSMPQCLQSLKVIDDQSERFLRLVIIGFDETTVLARLSWLDEYGIDHICCYLNGDFQSVQRKKNGLWVRDKHQPEEICLQKLGALRSPF